VGEYGEYFRVEVLKTITVFRLSDLGSESDSELATLLPGVYLLVRTDNPFDLATKGKKWGKIWLINMETLEGMAEPGWRNNMNVVFLDN
jgi:hypothetical protein